MKFDIDDKDKQIQVLVDDWIENATSDDIKVYAIIKLKQYYNSLTDEEFAKQKPWVLYHLQRMEKISNATFDKRDNQ
jgi:hypothetical protein